MAPSWIVGPIRAGRLGGICCTQGSTFDGVQSPWADAELARFNRILLCLYITLQFHQHIIYPIFTLP
jgi:hypothetical protein